MLFRSGAIHGPDAMGAHTLVLGLALDDAVGVEPELKTLLTDKADGFVKWDENESDGVKIHSIIIVPLIPNDFKKVLGNNATCHFALTKTGVLFSIGIDALNEMKRAITLKPTPAPVLDIRLNPPKLIEIVKPFSPRYADELGTILGTKDKLVSYSSLAVTGGEELRITLRAGLGMMTRWLGVSVP